MPDDLTTFIAEHADPLLAELVPLADAATRAVSELALVGWRPDLEVTS
jgi:hypothetical protein